jgi:two-component system KDP operon response regulator KdpE
MISVLDNEEEIVKALDNGASDFVTKPFRTNELLARIRACLNRNKVEDNKTVLIFNDLQIDLLARTVIVNNETVKLTATEYKLLVLFAKNVGRVLTHQFILKEIWGVGYQSDTQYLRVFVGTIRKKIEQNPNKPVHIITESGVGYRFI